MNENLYEDEPDVYLKEAIRHIYNRKDPDSDGIPILFLKAGGDEAIRVMMSLYNKIWKTYIMAK